MTFNETLAALLELIGQRVSISAAGIPPYSYGTPPWCEQAPWMPPESLSVPSAQITM